MKWQGSAHYGEGEDVVIQTGFEQYEKIPKIGEYYDNAKVVWRSNTYHGQGGYSDVHWELGLKLSIWKKFKSFLKGK